VVDEGLTTSFVTNGWHFARVWAGLQKRKEKVTHVSFSLDGTTRETHDGWRGTGSFDRLIQAISLCRRGGLRFNLKVGIRRDTLPRLEEFAIFAARMGASALSFAHLLPTGDGFEAELALNMQEQAAANLEVAELARIFKMRVGLDVGYYNIDTSRAPCSPLAGASCNIDYRGYLTLCCNLSGFRGAMGEAEVAGDLNKEDFGVAYQRLRSIVDHQLTKWREILGEYERRGVPPELHVGSPCLFCLDTFKKTPWRNQSSSAERRALPIVNGARI
jgi:MoaA/NifB/PqqE/SkfB family radical SAM enzyme